VVGELPLEAVQTLISTMWQLTAQVLVVIEPGTPHGFERIRLVRQQLIESGAFLVAPCPHAGDCPMANGDWCHFSQRLERSSMHMAVKSVMLGYEDEKFSYVVASKTPVVLPDARILRHPQHHSGHVDLQLCAQDGLEKRVISRRHGPLYKLARKLEWGDALLKTNA
jgi:ribosomal protein RSM22 (predicted rRNA methylase)